MPSGIRFPDLFGKKALENPKDLLRGVSVQASQTFDETASIDRADLVENDSPGLSAEGNSHSRRGVETSGCHGGHDDRTQDTIGFVRRDDNARPRFPDFVTLRGV